MLVRFDTAEVLRSDPRHAQALLLLSQALHYIVGDSLAAERNLRRCLRFSRCAHEHGCIERLERYSQVISHVFA